MAVNPNKLERILDAITDDIFNDIECAKSVIDEAGYDSTISLTEGKARVRQLQDKAFIELNEAIIYDIGGFSDVTILIPSLDYTVFHIRTPNIDTPQNFHEATIKLDYSESSNVEDDILLNSRYIDDGKLLFN